MARALIAPGELDQRLAFLVQASGQDAHGQPNGIWLPAPSPSAVWAKNGGVSSRDIAFGAASMSAVDAKWIIRARADITAAWRVQWRGQTYAIVGEPAPLAGDADWLEIRGRKVAPV